MAQEIDTRFVPAREMAVAKFSVSMEGMADMAERMGAAFGQVMGRLRAVDAVASGPAVACYQPMEGGFEVAAGFPVLAAIEEAGDGVVNLELPSGEVAHTAHVGPYDRLPQTYEALRVGVEAQGRHLDDHAPMWEEYLTGPEVPPEQARTEIYWPLAPG